MLKTIIKNATIINENKVNIVDILIEGAYIKKIDKNISKIHCHKTIDATGKYVFPGIIDDQVHFREPGLCHKGNIYAESRAAVAGGITSFMDMPNTIPQTLTQILLEEKYAIAARSSLSNYSFYMGVSNNNFDDVLKTNRQKVCGIKIFLGSSTGNMLVNNTKILEKLFEQSPTIIAAHCEDEYTIKKNLQKYMDIYGENIPIQYHPIIRSAEACYISAKYTTDLAKKYQTKFHLLHVSTAKELKLLQNIPLKNKNITAEVCIHHLWFHDKDYAKKGTHIKWNPAIKTKKDQDALWQALHDNRIDIIATDHAPHTLAEKSQSYNLSPSGGPMVEHSLVVMLEAYHQKKITLEKIVEKMCHNPAKIFQIKKRGYLREGYFADIVICNLNKPWRVQKNNIQAKCQWSPLANQTFKSSITHTIVSGHLAYHKGKFNDSILGKRLLFDR